MRRGGVGWGGRCRVTAMGLVEAWGGCRTKTRRWASWGLEGQEECWPRWENLRSPPEQKGSWQEPGGGGHAVCGSISHSQQSPSRLHNRLSPGAERRRGRDQGHALSPPRTDHWMEAGNEVGRPPEPTETCSFCFPECRAPTQESAGAPGTPGPAGAAKCGGPGPEQLCAGHPDGSLEVTYASAQDGGPAA